MRVEVGRFDWLAALYKRSPKFANLDPASLRVSYDARLALIADHRLKDGRRFGEMRLRSNHPRRRRQALCEAPDWSWW